VERVGVLCDMDNAKLFHVHFSPHPPQQALSDPSIGATEIIAAYFPGNYSETDRNTFEKGMRTLAAVAKEFDTCHDTTSGWVVEKLSIPDSDEEGTVYMVLVGWQSVEAHMAFRESQAFRDNIHHLHKAKDLKKIVMTHALCVESGR
jgi:heme-degrading monooxygenase HmoA